MNRPKILRPEESYTFAKYFELAYDIEDILADLDCSFERTLLTLPKTDQVIPEINELRQQILDGIKYVSITNEQARREFLIAPIIRQLCRQTHKRVRYNMKFSFDFWERVWWALQLNLGR